MTRTGRPAMPVERKRLLGNPGHRPLPAQVVALARLALTCQAPRSGAGEAMLRAVLEGGARAWIGPTDALRVEMAGRLWDDWQSAGQRWRVSRERADFAAYSRL